MASKNIITLKRRAQYGCDISHKITVYFFKRALQKKRRRKRGHTPSKVRSERREGTGDRVRLSGCETIPDNTFVRLRLRVAVKRSAPIKALSTDLKAKARLLPRALMWVNGSVPVPHWVLHRSACAAG